MTTPIDRATVRAVLDLFSPEACDFTHMQANNYGVIKLDLYTGDGDPVRYRGAEKTSRYAQRDGTVVTRGSGSYHLNDAAVDRVIEMIERRQQ